MSAALVSGSGGLVGSEAARIGDHIWWIGELSAFRRDYPEWELRNDLRAILAEIHASNSGRWASERVST